MLVDFQRHDICINLQDNTSRGSKVIMEEQPHVHKHYNTMNMFLFTTE